MHSCVWLQFLCWSVLLLFLMPGMFLRASCPSLSSSAHLCVESWGLMLWQPQIWARGQVKARRVYWGSMCEPAPQTPLAGTTNKSCLMCLDSSIFVHALHYSWGHGVQYIVVTVLIALKTIFCCPKVVGSRVPFNVPWGSTLHPYMMGRIELSALDIGWCPHWSGFFWESAVKFLCSGILITMLTTENWLVLCSDVSLECYLKYKMCHSVFDPKAPPSCDAF